MEAVIPAATAVVRTTAGASVSAGVWTLVGVVVTGMVTVAVAIIKQWGPWRKSESDGREADFARLRAEIDSQRLIHRQEIDGLIARTGKLEGDVEAARRDASAASEHATRSDAKLQTALTACEVLLGLVEREMPKASEIGLVKRLLAQAAASDLGIGDGMRKLSMMKGEGE